MRRNSCNNKNQKGETINKNQFSLPCLYWYLISTLYWSDCSFLKMFLRQENINKLTCLSSACPHSLLLQSNELCNAEGLLSSVYPVTMTTCCPTSGAGPSPPTLGGENVHAAPTARGQRSGRTAEISTTGLCTVYSINTHFQTITNIQSANINKKHLKNQNILIWKKHLQFFFVKSTKRTNTQSPAFYIVHSKSPKVSVSKYTCSTTIFSCTH